MSYKAATIECLEDAVGAMVSACQMMEQWSLALAKGDEVELSLKVEKKCEEMSGAWRIAQDWIVNIKKGTQ